MGVNQHYLFEARLPHRAVIPSRTAAPAAPPTRLWSAAAVVGLVAGTGLLVFLDPAWAHVLGVACLVLCAVAVFRLGQFAARAVTVRTGCHDLNWTYGSRQSHTSPELHT